VKSLAMESNGVYWIAPHEVLEAKDWRCCWWTSSNWHKCRGAQQGMAILRAIVEESGIRAGWRDFGTRAAKKGSWKSEQ
jgi:hypothetical protein